MKPFLANSPRVPLQTTQRHNSCSGGAVRQQWGKWRGSSSVGHVGCAGQTPGLVALPAPYPSLLSLLLHKEKETVERWSRDVIQGHEKSSQRNVEKFWGWLSLSSWHSAGITTNSVAITSKELQDILKPSSKPGLPLTEVRAMLPTFDTSHKQIRSLLVENFTKYFPLGTSTFLNISPWDLLAASLELPSLVLVIPAWQQNSAAKPCLSASGLQMWILIKNI